MQPFAAGRTLETRSKRGCVEWLCVCWKKELKGVVCFFDGDWKRIERFYVGAVP